MTSKLTLAELSVISFTTGKRAVLGGINETDECTHETWTYLWHMCPGPSGQVVCTWEQACRE